MMRRARCGVVAVWLGVALVPAGAGAQAAPDVEAEVLEVVHRLFEGMRTRDETLLRGVWHPDARLQTAGRDAEGAPRLGSIPIDGFVESVLGSEAYLDEVTFDEIVAVDGALAAVWAPYNLFVDDTFQHCGVDAIQMMRTSDGWKIFQLTDTRTQEGCDPERRN